MRKLSRFLSRPNSSQKGFTLIELLIVITVLGVLSVAVLSAINPIEIINRGKDTGSTSDSEQLLSAIGRYYATKGYYPWMTGVTDAGGTTVAWTQITAANPNDGSGAGGVDSLTEKLVTESQELLPAFTTRITATGYNPLFIYNEGNAGDSTYICYRATSRDQDTKGDARCAAAPADYPSGAAQACPATGNSYVCLP